ncbi:MAG: hypothetical protein KKE08_19520 [Gammaproteobacteria bacterium]|nr:hypothetical protein [Gammaproteobacteria bacterium]MBU2185219.1 hypothetical protein [Gammaproteobacteria bacterium]MBU2206294.1 hypothetical protein [Gammaproteobacteria bacterium]
MKFDKYSIMGRFAPAVISILVPAIVFNYFLVNDELSRFLGELLAVKLVAGLGMTFLFYYLLAQISRTIGKELFEKRIFKDEKFMPTTNFLMYSDDTYSEQHKIRIRSLIEEDFKVVLPTKEQESINENESRMIISETMASVRKKLHGNEFLLKHNIEYGFIRNLIGGSVLGLIFSLANIALFRYLETSSVAVQISIFTAVFYAIVLLFGRFLIKVYGESYAKILFREYLG